MIVTLLLGIVISAAYGLYYRGFVIWLREKDRVEVQENLRIALDRMGRELRTAGGLSAGSNAGQLEFTDQEGRTVKYYYSSSTGQLLRSRIGGANPVASNIKSVDIAYQGALVTITLTGEKGRSGPITMNTKIRIRAAA